MKVKMKIYLAVLSAIFIMAFAGSAFAGAPTERVKNAADKVIDILKDPKLKGPAHEEQRRAKIMATAETVFDYREMAKRSLAIFWRQRTPKEQDQFVKLFSDLLERSYINRIEGYTNEKVVYDSEKIDGDHATVDSRIITKRHEEIPVNYQMMTKNGNWWVYDIVIENVSLVNNYRVQFNKIIRSSSYAELLKKLQNKEESENLAAPGTK
jgi:phospholipid transport system substrate-binding protein